MRRELIISYAAHGLILLLAFILTAFSRPMKLPEKVYSVKIVAASQPRTAKQPEEKPVPKPQEKPQIETKPEPKPQRKPEPPRQTEPEPRRTSPTGKGHVTVDGADFKDDYYLNLIYMKVYRNWIAPTSGGKLTAVIYFRIIRNGEVKDAKVEKRSGSANYDQKALRTILASSPFPELPENYTGDQLGVHFEFAHRP